MNQHLHRLYFILICCACMVSVLTSFRAWQVLDCQQAVVHLLSTPITYQLAKEDKKQQANLSVLLHKGHLELQKLSFDQTILLKWSTKELEEPIKLRYFKIDSSKGQWWRLSEHDNWQPISNFTVTDKL